MTPKKSKRKLRSWRELAQAAEAQLMAQSAADVRRNHRKAEASGWPGGYLLIRPLVSLAFYRMRLYQETIDRTLQQGRLTYAYLPYPDELQASPPGFKAEFIRILNEQLERYVDMFGQQSLQPFNASHVGRPAQACGSLEVFMLSWSLYRANELN